MADKKWMRVLALFLLLFILVGLRFGGYFKNPGGIIEPYGDGFKAYTVIDYHAEHDSTFMHFEGMNYPFGEHITPAATQPLISNAIRYISQNFVDVTDYTIAVVNMSMLISIVLCGLFLFLILDRLELPWWYSILVAAGVTFLSPQIHRMVAHYGLAHLEVVPALIYFLMRYSEARKFKFSIAIALVILFYSLIHFYYFAIASFTVSFYFLVNFLREKAWKKLPRLALDYGIQIIVPLVFFIFFLILPDTIEDRSPEPWGFFNYHALWEGIVSSMDQPYFKWIDNNVITIRPTGLENKAYIGIVAFFTAFFAGGVWVFKNRFKKPLFNFENPYSSFLNDLFWSSFLILIFALGVPFTIKGLEFLLDYAGPIRQFRSVGRFAWLFYYALNVIIFYWLYEKTKGKKWQLAILVPALLLLCMEAYNSAYSKNLDMDPVKEMEEGKAFTDLEGINYEEYQAILTVPYYSIGSENFWWEPEGFILQKSLLMSTQTGLPVTSVMMTRTSLGQTLKQLQLVSEPYRTPVILEDFPNEKPLLLMLDQKEYEKEKERYEHLFEGAELIYTEGDRLRLFHLPLATFQDRIEQKVEQIRERMVLDSSLVWRNNMASTDSLVHYYYDSMDENESERVYYGSGARDGISNQNNVIDIPAIPNLKAGEAYILSLWLYLKEDRIVRTPIRLDELDADGNYITHHSKTCNQIIDLFDPNGWGLIEMEFVPNEQTKSMRVSLENKDLRGKPIHFDELLIRPKATDVFGRRSDTYWLNNRHYYR